MENFAFKLDDHWHTIPNFQRYADFIREQDAERFEATLREMPDCEACRSPCPPAARYIV